MTTKASHPSLLIGIVLAADLAIAVLGIRSIAAAHSAEPVAQNGRLVWAEQDTQRTSNYWLLAIGTLRNRYRVETSDYSPDLPDLLGLVGQPVTIWTDGSSRNVLGLRIANQTSLTLFGRHPALQRMWGLELGIFLVEIAVVPWAIYLWVRMPGGVAVSLQVNLENGEDRKGWTIAWTWLPRPLAGPQSLPWCVTSLSGLPRMTALSVACG